uniref:Putative WD repeat protein 90 n=2 Tax=Toxoplasma gondii TaxID=5811 RepID=A0A2G8XXM2_TOXGO|nr:putative WD repeat protein 90 [Toxoplasma gondii COUG]
MASAHLLCQGPYVNVLKAFPLHDEENCRCQGDVTEETVYMQIKAMQSRHFVIHLDISTIEKLCVRATFSNMVKEPKVTSRTIQYPCHPSPGVWTMLCINTPTLLGQYTRLVPKGMVLKSMQICANIKLRGIYTSDILYPQNMLPRGMRLSPKTTVEDCQWIYAPLGSRPDDVLPITGDESDDDEFFSCGKGDSCSKAEIRTTAAATDPNEGEEPGLRNSRNGAGIGGTGDQIAVEGMQADCSWISKSSNRGGGTAVTQGEPLLPSSLFSRGALLQVRPQ